MTVQQAEEILARKPHSPLFAYLADQYLFHNRLEDAKKLLSRIEKYPDYTTARLILAKCYAADKDFTSAIETIQKIIPLYSDATLLRQLLQHWQQEKEQHVLNQTTEGAVAETLETFPAEPPAGSRMENTASADILEQSAELSSHLVADAVNSDTVSEEVTLQSSQSEAPPLQEQSLVEFPTASSTEEIQQEVLDTQAVEEKTVEREEPSQHIPEQAPLKDEEQNRERTPAVDEQHAGTREEVVVGQNIEEQATLLSQHQEQLSSSAVLEHFEKSEGAETPKPTESVAESESDGFPAVGELSSREEDKWVLPDEEQVQKILKDVEIHLSLEMTSGKTPHVVVKHVSALIKDHRGSTDEPRSVTLEDVVVKISTEIKKDKGEHPIKFNAPETMSLEAQEDGVGEQQAPPLPEAGRMMEEQSSHDSVSSGERETREEKPLTKKKESRIVTKTLAEIYAKQGGFREAILIYKLLKQQQPEKSDDYDERIQELETLMKNKQS